MSQANAQAERRNGQVVKPEVIDPAVVPKATRRRYSAEYKLRVLREADGYTEPGQVGAEPASRAAVVGPASVSLTPASTGLYWSRGWQARISS